jgi:phosphonate transport system permease protein
VSQQEATRTVGSRRPDRPRTSWSTWAALLGFLAVTAWAWSGVGFTLAPLFTEQATRGFQIIRRFFDPDWAYLARVWPAFLETLYMAIIGSMFGCAFALPVSLLCSKVTNQTRVLFTLMRTLLSIVRSLPDVAWALLFVAAVGTGALAGILALIVFNIGVVAKLTSETVDGVDLGPLEAADAAGATRVQRAWAAVVPQVLPGYLSYSLYVFELNLRASIVLGLVGAGGIGNIVNLTLSRLEWERMGAVILLLFAIVVVIDQASIAMRKRLV